MYCLKNTYKFGLFAEMIAKIYLQIQFYKIIAMRYRNNFGEIDIIAKIDKTIVFVEVKARKKDQYEILTVNQRKRIKNAASMFIAHNSKYQNYDLRFDLIMIKPYCWPTHLKNAW